MRARPILLSTLPLPPENNTLGYLANPETSAKLAYHDEVLLIMRVNVVGLFGCTVLPDKLGDNYAVVSTTNWNYAATAALEEMFALIFQEPAIDVG